MVTILCDHQTGYLPWCGLFHRISLCDIYISLDNVKFHRRSWDDRNKIKTPEGFLWLKVPTLKGNSKLLKDIKINNNINWQDQHLKSIERSYKNTPFYDYYFTRLKDIINKKHEYLLDLNEELLRFLLEELNIKAKFFRASELDVSGKNNSYLINLCKHFNAEGYVFGQMGIGYADVEMWKKESIKLHFHKYNHPVYQQKFSDFIPELSVIDLLFNLGPVKARETILRRNTSKSELAAKFREQN